MARHDIPDPRKWGLSIDPADELELSGIPLRDLAHAYGTPLHVVDGAALARRVRSMTTAARTSYPGQATIHYAMKCNGVPGIVARIRDAGANVEVMSALELETALRIGYRGSEIIANGPCKPDPFLRLCLQHRVGLIVVDSLEELERLSNLARSYGRVADVLLRVNPDIVPSGMNAGSATGSRTGSAFGFDLKGGEVEDAVERLRTLTSLRLRGFHVHIGTGIAEPLEYRPAVLVLAELMGRAHHAGFAPDVIDIGGGFAAPHSREFTSREMLTYAAFGWLPRLVQPSPEPSVFIETIAAEVRAQFAGQPLPHLLFEPGRSIAGPSQHLLLSVLGVKHRPGIGRWIVTDGGLGTVTMPTYYEVHEVFPCQAPMRPRTTTYTILGPGCFSGDIVYRHKRLPSVATGDVLALMDTGAYFTALESNFGHPRPAVVCVENGGVSLLRRRETADEFFARDDKANSVLHEPDTLHEVMS
jgi:diaminopimelate decarboxylase